VATIHPTAVVSPEARLGDGVRIGPFCVVEGGVELAAGVVLVAHACVLAGTTVGTDVQVEPFAVLGGAPQHRGDDGAGATARIGARCRVREHATVHRGTGGGATVVGDDCLLMVGAHVGHDAQVGDGVVLANGAMLGGHVRVGDGAWIGGAAAVHQLARVGAHAFVGGGTIVRRSVLPFALAEGHPAVVAGPNLVGLRRAGWSRDRIARLRAAFAALAGPGTLPERIARAESLGGDDVQRVVAFARDPGPRRLAAMGGVG
jgi:UDP-N-acetylglucosamine acyltransferase